MGSAVGSSGPWVRVPTMVTDDLDRPRLRQMLDAARCSSSVITVIAGAGYGKSTLLATWARQTSGRCAVAWVDCRMAVRSPGGLRQAILHALGQVLPDPDIARAGVASPHGFYRLLVLATSERPLVLVLDDLHEVQDEASLESLNVLLAYPPDGLTLVLASRRDPPLRLARLRADGRVVELRAPELALDAEETAALLASRGLDLDARQRQRVAAVTRAWPVAVRLAANALTDADDPAEVLDDLASDRGVADYLESEVFAGWEPEWRTVMTDASIVARFCPMLLGELSHTEHADVVLASVAARSGLLSPSTGAPGWWELHPLARTYLAAELAADGRRRTRELHTRAAHWFVGQEMRAPALEHAIEARDPELLEEIVAHIGIEPLLRWTADASDIARLFARTDPSRFTGAGSMALAVALLAANDPRAAAVVCAPLRRARPGDPRLERLRAVAIARVDRTTATGGGGLVALHEASREGASAAELVLLQAEQALSPPSRYPLRQNRDRLSAALASAEVLEADRVALELRVALGGLALIAGDSRMAYRYANEALGAERWLGTELARPLAEARVIGATAALDLGASDVVGCTQRATASLRGLSGSAPWTLAAAAIEALTPRPDTDDPRARLDRLGRTLDDTELTGVGRGLLTAVIDVEVRLAGAVHDVHRLERAVTRFPTHWSGTAEGAYLRAQAHRLARSDAAARRELQPAVDGLLAPAWPAMRLRILALDGMLAHRCGEPDPGSLGAALALTSRTGRIGPFLALGGDMFDALLSWRLAMRSHAQLVDGLLARMGGPASPLASVEPLTSAEHVVLRRLDSMATLEEIATGLQVSRNTVKSHTAAIYRKLGVGSRRSALARAQQLRLL